MSSNCVNINGEVVNVPFRSYAGTDITDYRSAVYRENEIKKILQQNGCDASGSYEFKNCVQKNWKQSKGFLDSNINKSLNPNICNNNK